MWKFDGFPCLAYAPYTSWYVSLIASVFAMGIGWKLEVYLELGDKLFHVLLDWSFERGRASLTYSCTYSCYFCPRHLLNLTLHMYVDFELLTKSFGEAKILFFRVLGMWQFIGGFLAGFLPNSTCYLLMRVLTYCDSKHLTRLWSFLVYWIWVKPKRFTRKKLICSKTFDYSQVLVLNTESLVSFSSKFLPMIDIRLLYMLLEILTKHACGVFP